MRFIGIDPTWLNAACNRHTLCRQQLWERITASTQMNTGIQGAGKHLHKCISVMLRSSSCFHVPQHAARVLYPQQCGLVFLQERTFLLAPQVGALMLLCSL